MPHLSPLLPPLLPPLPLLLDATPVPTIMVLSVIKYSESSVLVAPPNEEIESAYNSKYAFP